MSYDHSKIIELYLLKAENCSEELAPNQKKYYLEAAKWLQNNSFDSIEDATSAMKKTEFYEGAALAQQADDSHVRNKAKEVTGDRPLELKEAMGRIFSGYMNITGNPQQEHRLKAAEDIAGALKVLEAWSVSFDELISDEGYAALTMATEKGLESLKNFIHEFMDAGCRYIDDLSDIQEEQFRLADWVKKNKAELAAVGKHEIWRDACCIAVPSNAKHGYDFVALQEVE